MANKKCVNCGHSINEHDFSHKSECRAGNCDCDEFIFETKKDKLLKKIDLYILSIPLTLKDMKEKLKLDTSEMLSLLASNTDYFDLFLGQK